MSPRSGAGSGWRWITAAIMPRDAALTRTRGHRDVSVRQARAGEAPARGGGRRADRLRQGRSARADRPDDPPGAGREPDGDLDLSARGGAAGVARGGRRLVRGTL